MNTQPGLTGQQNECSVLAPFPSAHVPAAVAVENEARCGVCKELSALLFQA
eukprot:XP_001704331.1 Hypothetical protein GL50803_37977 [Giardia lamblia ATCC 50803]